MSKFVRTGLSLSFIVITGCSAGAPEDLAHQVSALTPTTYDVDADNGPSDVTTTFSPPGGGGPGTPGFCFLMKVAGGFESVDAEVDLYAGGDGYWHVKAAKGSGDTNGPIAKYGCLALADFSGLPGGGEFAERHDVATSPALDTASTNIDGGNKFCPLTGAGGRMDYPYQPPLTIAFGRSVWDSTNGYTTLYVHRGPGYGGPENVVHASTWCIGYPPGASFNWSYSSVHSAPGTLTATASTQCMLDDFGGELSSSSTYTQIGTSGSNWTLTNASSDGLATCIPAAQ